MDELLKEIISIQKKLYEGFKADKESNLDWLNVSKTLNLPKVN